MSSLVESKKKEEKVKGTESIFKAVMTEKLPNLGKKWTSTSMRPKTPNRLNLIGIN